MKWSCRQRTDERGSVLVIALLALAILTLIGAVASRTTSIELLISGTQRFHTIAFHHADSGVYTVPKVISASFESSADANLAGITYLGSGGTFYRELMGYDGHDADRDLRMVIGGRNVDVDVNRLGQESLAGRGAEFAAGAEGVGAGSTGGVAIVYAIDSLGHGPASSVSNVTATYRKIIGLPGGL